ncbi:hemerythrin domain-containing protein [Undibacterium parvum]|uniref:Hemerythrin domain-containing protein n=1 Tax=Undibacterium parvum TaxID=401471 RepID=A0A3S9HNA2_9BURK|nr:hemerythrin domain-containing protein [Undibacterium parvum]AZP13593.1 hemerythrin domain-containing protein [Undibacterium parvum]
MPARISTPISILIIQEEHQHLASIMERMLSFVRSLQEVNSNVDLSVFRAMLYYIGQYPERVHHPKEDQYLFAKIKDRTHQLDVELDTLTEQHAKGELLAHRLLDALHAYEFGGIDALPHFRTLVEQYAHFYFAHMRMEEERILPVALQVLNDADWNIIDTAFLENRKMMDDEGQRYHYDQLYSRIMGATPGPQ